MVSQEETSIKTHPIVPPVRYVNFIACGSSILRSHLRQPSSGALGGHTERVPPASAHGACLGHSSSHVPLSEDSPERTAGRAPRVMPQ